MDRSFCIRLGLFTVLASSRRNLVREGEREQCVFALNLRPLISGFCPSNMLMWWMIGWRWMYRIVSYCMVERGIIDCSGVLPPLAFKNRSFKCEGWQHSGAMDNIYLYLRGGGPDGHQTDERFVCVLLLWRERWRLKLMVWYSPLRFDDFFYFIPADSRHQTQTMTTSSHS